MGETRRPVRHRRPATRRVAPGAVGTTLATAPTGAATPTGDLQAVFTTLARRVKLPTGPDARPAEVLRATGLPLLMAAVVAGGQPPAAAAGGAPLAATAPQAGSDAWSVTPLDVAPAAGTAHGAAGTAHGATGTAHGAAGAAEGGAPGHGSSHHPAAQRSSPAPARPVVPAKGAAAAPPRAATSSRAARSASPAVRITYTVRPGDTVSEIALRSGRSPAEIIELNHLGEKASIRPGQVLVLPDPLHAPAGGADKPPSRTDTEPGRHPAAPTASTRTHVVAAGDTLIGICTAAHVDLATVLQLNHLHRDTVIHPGQKLLLPATPPSTFLGRTYPPAVVAAAAANRRALAGATVPSHAQAKAMVIATAKKQGVDPALALGVAYHESGFEQRMVSPANAVGVMQVIPSSGMWASSVVGRRLDLLKTQDNITAGVALLRALTASARNEPEAIAGYYQGLSSVRAHGMYDDTRRYVANVQTLKARFAAEL